MRRIPRAESWGWLPVLALTSACGLLLLALAYASGYSNSAWGDVLLYAGLVLMFVPLAARMFSAAPSRRERIGIAVVGGLAFYLVKVLRNPLMFAGFDELLHRRTAQDILNSGHLFHGNSLLPVSPLYPGLEIVTTAVVRLTGLSIFESGILVVGVARVLFVLALYLFLEEVSNSSRVAGIASLLYMTNLNFVFFDAQFAYESLALPLGMFALYLIARRLRRHETCRGATLAVLLTITAMVVTHHLTSFAFIAFLILVFGIGLVSKQSAAERIGLLVILAFSVAAALAWLVWIAPVVIYYLSPYAAGSVQQMIGLVLNQVMTRPLFTDYAGQGAPVWERWVSLASVALALLALPLGLIQIYRRYRPYLNLRLPGPASPITAQAESDRAISIIPLALGVASLAYGATLPLRLMPDVAEISARSAGFLLIAIAFVASLDPVQRWFSSRVELKWRAGLTLWATILFIGGFILGAGPSWERLPGPYLVSADVRSIEPEGIAAANWVLNHLGAGNRIAADRVNGLLMGSYALQHPLTDLNDRVDVSLMYFTTEWDEGALWILNNNNLQYIIVDHRLTTGLPRVGVYFQSVEPSAYQHKTPIPEQALAKFDLAPNLSRIFDSGDIEIYAVQETGRPYVQP